MLNVLIVDDNKAFVDGMIMMLTNFHTQHVGKIFTAYSGEECLN